ncbi:MAG: hypothetical protein JJ892_07525 [Balneola sp.]|uniref:hypothetical protein n=1 Tax=Balneola sp. EhC07 TaxID=1849360 RepID=UPI0007F352C2|nr:hypothetical protein [Balneola sp. EhC07]MBO6623000.1 hypothetical protein [Balneola sp.]MBO6651676.1 hypothetical protein [Balneola sp.]MBO6711918.1 hypothetical protein [Balneola sp.]MBO6800113.1 hypothetical protein [Balneola sp.]MBO6871618.1 hypothetical protein [Balneola sp.]
MKNIQVIDGADNCTYDIFAVSEEDFDTLFPKPNQNIEFIEDVVDRIGEQKIRDLNSRLWNNRILKEDVNGIHGTLFYQLLSKKKYYPSKIDLQD